MPTIKSARSPIVPFPLLTIKRVVPEPAGSLIIFFYIEHRIHLPGNLYLPSSTSMR